MIYILLTIKLRLKKKYYLIYIMMLWLAIRPRINKKFKIIIGFLLKNMLFLIIQNFNSKIR